MNPQGIHLKFKTNSQLKRFLSTTTTTKKAKLTIQQYALHSQAREIYSNLILNYVRKTTTDDKTT